MTGLIPMFDPPRDDTKETIHRAEALGVEVKMITGLSKKSWTRKVALSFFFSLTDLSSSSSLPSPHPPPDAATPIRGPSDHR